MHLNVDMPCPHFSICAWRHTYSTFNTRKVIHGLYLFFKSTQLLWNLCTFFPPLRLCITVCLPDLNHVSFYDKHNDEIFKYSVKYIGLPDKYQSVVSITIDIYCRIFSLPAISSLRSS